MSESNRPEACQAFRGPILYCLDDPGNEPTPRDRSVVWLPDGLLIVADGRIVETGDAAELLPTLPAGTEVTHWPDALLVPGFIDTHVHMPQLGVIASYGAQLLDWLDTYTFPNEARFADTDWAYAEAERFMDLLLAHGTTSGMVFCTSHPQSADATFAAAEQRGMALVAGKCMMDRHGPEDLLDTAESSDRDSRALLARWHNRGRLRYAITPRFAPTSTHEQLTVAGQLVQDYPDAFVQTHWAENLGEIEWVRALFPERSDYLDVYQHYGLLGSRTVLAHGIHINDHDRQRVADTDTRIAFCPTSNTFLGSGLFDLASARDQDIRVGLASDVGGGTSLSMLATMGEGYKVCQLNGQTLTPWQAFYLATLGNARVLHQADETGSFEPGRQADFVVLDPASNLLLERKQENRPDWAEQLFNLMILADDRAVDSTWIAGQCRYRRKAS